MLLKGYSLEIFKSKCNAAAIGVHCHAHLTDDVSDVLPYLNTVLGGHIYTENPPSLSLKIYNKLITIHARKIAVNALNDREEAEKIIAWLQREINDAWENRAAIEPSTKSAQQPQFLEIFKLLPRTNCKQCGDPTCMVFATKVLEGGRDQNDCPAIDPQKKVQLQDYLAQFSFD